MCKKIKHPWIIKVAARIPRSPPGGAGRGERGVRVGALLLLFLAAPFLLGGHGPLSTRRRSLIDPYDPRASAIEETLIAEGTECVLRMSPKTPGPDDIVTFDIAIAHRESRTPVTAPLRVSVDATRAWRNVETWAPFTYVAAADGHFRFSHLFFGDGLYQVNLKSVLPGSDAPVSFAWPVRVGTADTGTSMTVLTAFAIGIGALVLGVAVARARKR